MPEIVTRAKQHGKKVTLFPLHEECIDLGTIVTISRHALA